MQMHIFSGTLFRSSHTGLARSIHRLAEGLCRHFKNGDLKVHIFAYFDDKCLFYMHFAYLDFKFIFLHISRENYIFKLNL